MIFLISRQILIGYKWPESSLEFFKRAVVTPLMIYVMDSPFHDKSQHVEFQIHQILKLWNNKIC